MDIYVERAARGGWFYEILGQDGVMKDGLHDRLEDLYKEAADFALSQNALTFTFKFLDDPTETQNRLGVERTVRLAEDRKRLEKALRRSLQRSL